MVFFFFFFIFTFSNCEYSSIPSPVFEDTMPRWYSLWRPTHDRRCPSVNETITRVNSSAFPSSLFSNNLSCIARTFRWPIPEWHPVSPCYVYRPSKTSPRTTSTGAVDPITSSRSCSCKKLNQKQMCYLLFMSFWVTVWTRAVVCTRALPLSRRCVRGRHRAGKGERWIKFQFHLRKVCPTDDAGFARMSLKTLAMWLMDMSRTRSPHCRLYHIPLKVDGRRTVGSF